MSFSKHFHSYLALSFISYNMKFLWDRTGLSQEKVWRRIGPGREMNHSCGDRRMQTTNVLFSKFSKEWVVLQNLYCNLGITCNSLDTNKYLRISLTRAVKLLPLSTTPLAEVTQFSHLDVNHCCCQFHTM